MNEKHKLFFTFPEHMSADANLIPNCHVSAHSNQANTAPVLWVADLHSTAVLSLQVDKVITLEQLVGELCVADA